MRTAGPDYLNEADRARISAAVAEAEAHSAGEIVTVLADRSDGYTDVAMAWGVAAMIAALAALAIAPDFFLGIYERLSGGWHGEWTRRDLFTLAALVAALKFAGMMLIQLWQPARFFLIPPPIKAERVHHGAVRAFRMAAQNRTHGRTGILVYISMRERRAEIVADEAIASKIAPEVWGDAMHAMLADLRQGRVADGMIAGVEQVGKVLAGTLPSTQVHGNELPDRLIEV